MRRRTRRRTRRRKRRRRGGTWNNDFAKIVANAKFKAAPTVTEHEVEQERIRFEPTRLEFLKSGQEIALASPLRRGKQGGRQYPKSRTHVYSRVTPTHNISKRSRSRRSKSKSRSRSRSRRRSRSRSRRRRRRKRAR